MNVSDFSELNEGLRSEPDEREIVSSNSSRPRTGAALLVQDSVNQRLIEAALVQLGLKTVMLDQNFIDLETLSGFEFIVADVPAAQQVRAMLATREEKGEGINPAVIAVCQRELDVPLSLDHPDTTVDGMISLPMAPAQVVAQLSIFLYAHRAFARRYHSALEELHLNRRIFRSVTSGISVTSADGDMPLVYVNPAFEVMTGYSLEEVVGKNCRILQCEERDQPGVTLIREAIRNQREVVAIVKNFRKDGTSFWNELSLSPIRNREGVLTHFVGIQTDVTARVEFEAALRESEKLAAVGRLASSIAHEINNPLESMMNLLYLAQGSDSLEESRSYLDIADRELQRVKLITSQSLRFYKQSTRPQAVCCSDLLDSVLDLYHPRFMNAGISIERRQRATQSIVCMESEVRQVLNNLVSNAIDATRGKGGCLYVRSREGTEWRSMTPGVVITIADNGYGIGPDTMKNIYKAFYTTKGIGGTGLGLWISSEIVERHHGRLMVRSSQRKGKSGTIFELFLPYQGLTS